ncbi:MAG: hypothetical protein A2016_02580 [Elusimicrobia bacterium GWF2_62_30]|nr:MAG: hypothetical protein A2016_02580 [Elusimicrobia bacterium GWF2_62_30]
MLAGCSRRDEATVGTPANPLVVVLSPAHAPSAGALDFLKKHLESATAMTVRLDVAATPADTIKKFSAGLADAGLVTVEEYLVAREEYGVHAPLQALRGNSLAEYEGAIVTLAAGGAKSAEELAGKKVGFVGPYSVSGFTLPCIYFTKAGITPVREYAAGHDAAVKKLMAGEVAAIATYAAQAARRPGLKILAVTGKVPNEPVIVRSSLSPEKRTLLVSAFMTLGDTKAGRTALAELADIKGFRSVDEAVYKPLHDLLLSEGKAVYDLVPDGWEIQRLSQPYMPN